MMFRRSLSTERTVKRLMLSKALTIPDHTTVYEACRRMASRRVDAVLLTDSNALLCGILTDKVGSMHLPFTCPSPMTWESIDFSLTHRMLCSVYWNQDITTRVIARKLKLEETPVSKVMTRNPTFVLADMLAVEALQKMVQGV
jgi:CBS domain-containing protein